MADLGPAYDPEKAALRYADVIAQLQGEIERLRSLLERIIQVRGGCGMLEGAEALDEMARLAGEGLAGPSANREGLNNAD